MKDKKKLKSILLTLIEFIALIFLTRFMFTKVFNPVSVDVSSMKPTVYDRDIGLVNVFDASHQEYHRFDVVVIKMDEKKDYLIKRVIGLPGETIAYRDDHLYVNGVLVEEDFLDKEYVEATKKELNSPTFTQDVIEITLKENEYYCLGDNRPHSSDSRVYGPFRYDEIKGKGILILFPFNHMTWAD